MLIGRDVDNLLVPILWNIDYKELNIAKLAWLGDSLYELYIRQLLFLQAGSNSLLHRRSIHYVNAAFQAKLLRFCLEDNCFNEEEKALVRRAENFRAHSRAKNQDPQDYQAATALEALLAYLYLQGKTDKITAIIGKIAAMEMKEIKDDKERR